MDALLYVYAPYSMGVIGLEVRATEDGDHGPDEVLRYWFLAMRGYPAPE